MSKFDMNSLASDIRKQFKDNPKELEAHLTEDNASVKKAVEFYKEHNKAATPKDIEEVRKQAIAYVQKYAAAIEQAIKPTKAIEVINIGFIITKQGASFDNLV